MNKLTEALLLHCTWNILEWWFALIHNEILKVLKYSLKLIAYTCLYNMIIFGTRSNTIHRLNAERTHSLEFHQLGSEGHRDRMRNSADVWQVRNPVVRVLNTLEVESNRFGRSSRGYVGENNLNIWQQIFRSEQAFPLFRTSFANNPHHHIYTAPVLQVFITIFDKDC